MARKTKTQAAQTEATEMSLEEALAEEAEEVRSNSPLMHLTEKALVSVRDRATLQRPVPDKKHGRDWRVVGVARGNLRHAVLDALASLDEFTMEEAMAAIKHLPLNSGTPRSFIKAFIKSGYVA